MAIITMPAFYGHQIAGREATPKGIKFDYVLAGNGLFIRARRAGMSVQFSLKEFVVEGLPELVPTFEMDHPRVPLALTRSMILVSQQYGEEGLETLFHFTLDDAGNWEMHSPEQTRSRASCRPLEDGAGSTYERAFIEAHSHHKMAAYFSSIDDRDETGFRIYVVVGRLNLIPRIRVRVGVYGHFWEIPAEWVFEMPDGLIDCAGERR